MLIGKFITCNNNNPRTYYSFLVQYVSSLSLSACPVEGYPFRMRYTLCLPTHPTEFPLLYSRSPVSFTNTLAPLPGFHSTTTTVIAYGSSPLPSSTPSPTHSYPVFFLTVSPALHISHYYRPFNHWTDIKQIFIALRKMPHWEDSLLLWPSFLSCTPEPRPPPSNGNRVSYEVDNKVQTIVGIQDSLEDQWE